MTTSRYTARYAHLTAQRAYSRAIARRGLVAALEPYTVKPKVMHNYGVIPVQRRRVVERERIGA